MRRIGIVVLATNAYFILGLRFIKRFAHFYKGDSQVTFYFFSDTNPIPYIPSGINIQFIRQSHDNWVEGTNSKFKNFLLLEDELRRDQNYVFYFDADTNIDKDFTEEWMIGDMVGGEHYGNRCFPKLPFERHPKSKAFVPEDTPLKQMYYYGAFFGGKVDNVLYFCKKMIEHQQADRAWGYEPGVNDESYINQWFHFNPPTHTVPCDGFKFLISDKGGIGETRKTSLDIEALKKEALENKDRLFDIQNGIIVYDV